jgi:mitochondrial cardiolipin hydrolase
MNIEELDQILLQTFADRRLSRTERKALSAVFADHCEHPERLPLFRQRVFAVARRQLPGTREVEVLDWLEEVVGALDQALGTATPPPLAEAHFSPGEGCRHRTLSLIDHAHASVDVCVFAISDDHLSRALVAAHHRGALVRVITDDDKAFDRGSDVEELARFGIEVRMDRSEYYMHHKFALFDRRILLTGSYNWTRSAAEHNQENLIVSDDRRLLGAFQVVFDQLWEQFRPG